MAFGKCILPGGCRDPSDCTGRCVATNLEDTRRIFSRMVRTEANGWPLCEHTVDEPGCVPCCYRRWANIRSSTLKAHIVAFEAFCAGYAAISVQQPPQDKPSKNLCRYCHEYTVVPCMSTRDMEDRFAPRCRDALLRAGGGEYIVNQAASRRVPWLKGPAAIAQHLEDLKHDCREDPCAHPDCHCPKPTDTAEPAITRGLSDATIYSLVAAAFIIGIAAGYLLRIWGFHVW